MTEIKQNETRFEIFKDGEKAGLLDYQKKENGIIEIIHTEVSDKFGGQGLGKELVKTAVEYAQNYGYKIIPSCPYAKKIIAKTPEFQDVLV
jgi:predicted GNAT family acetyltransferase